MSTTNSPSVTLGLRIKRRWQATDMPSNTESDLALSLAPTIHGDSANAANAANAIDPFTTSFPPLPHASHLLRLPNQSP